MIDRYVWPGGEEAMLRFGPDTGSVAIVALPLFEEANRTRAFAVTLCRALAERGIASVLPDMPGQGESVMPLESLSLLRVQEGYEGLADQLGAEGRRIFGVGIRSGALLDAFGLIDGRWHFAPQGGPDLLRELTRLKQLETGRPLGEYWYCTDGDAPAHIAGNAISTNLLIDLTVKQPFDEPGIPRRVVRLATDPAAADRKVDAAPLWRRAEPDNDPALAKLLADDIADWISDFYAPPIRLEPVEGHADKTRASTSSARTVMEIACKDSVLAGTLDPAPGATGLLIVSGGNEIRIGAHRGMALLAERVAATGHPVFRFDRRGVGDSPGENSGFVNSADDIAAATAHFRTAQPQVTRVVGFGNCDAATALALFGTASGTDAQVLANPWIVEEPSDLPPPAAIRARYAAKAKEPREWVRLLTGGINVSKLGRGLKRARATAVTGLAERFAAALPADATILTASRDNTAIAFRAALPGLPVMERDTASHSFAGPGDADWLFEQVMGVLDAS